MDRKPERPCQVLTQVKLGGITAQFGHSPHESLKCPVEEAGVSRWSMRTVTKLLKLRIHTTRLGHSLQYADL
jgi:hypothetical protein